MSKLLELVVLSNENLQKAIPVTDSIIMAEEFDILHKNLLREIEKIEKDFKNKLFEGMDIKKTKELFIKNEYIHNQNNQIYYKYEITIKGFWIIIFRLKLIPNNNFFKYIEKLNLDYNCLIKGFNKTKNRPKKLYIIQNTNTNNIKIGISSNYMKRIKSLQNANENNLKLIYCFGKDVNRRIEKDIHNYFKEFRMVGEWFSANILDVINYIDEIYNSPYNKINSQMFIEEIKSNKNKYILIKSIDYILKIYTEELYYDGSTVTFTNYNKYIFPNFLYADEIIIDKYITLKNVNITFTKDKDNDFIWNLNHFEEYEKTIKLFDK